MPIKPQPLTYGASIITQNSFAALESFVIKAFIVVARVQFCISITVSKIIAPFSFIRLNETMKSKGANLGRVLILADFALVLRELMEFFH